MRRLLRALAPLAIFFPTAAVADWREHETAHFLIVSESPPAEVEEFAGRLESYDKLMRMATGTKVDDPVKVRIYEVRSLSEVEQALGEHNSGIAGFYDSNVLGPYAVTPHKTGDTGRYFTPELVLHHEYAHHFMLQYFPAIYPSWYVEGFAELIGSSEMIDDNTIGYGMPAKHRGHDIAANWVPLDELLSKERIVYLDTYAQGWAVTHFLTFDKKRSAQLRQYLAELGRGKSLAEASKAFGDLPALNREALRYVTSGSFEYRPVKVNIDRPAIRKARALSAGEAALIPQTIAFRDDDLLFIRREGDRKREERLRRNNLESIREKTRRFPADPYALMLLGEAEYASGNFSEARAATDRLLAIEPNNVRGLSRKSLVLSQLAAKLGGPERAAAIAEARKLAARANRLDVNQAIPLLAYYQSFNLVGEKVPEMAANGLIQVVSMLPSDDSVRQLLVDQLARDQRFDEAIGWLMLIANAPHESPRRTAAREQMEKLKAARAAAKTASAP